MFKPKILDTLKIYDRHQFSKDLMAGVIVGIVALPLAIAFAIASGVSPEKGLFTAVIGGFVISALGGSRVQIGGPTGAFIVIVYGIVQEYGINGLIIATFMAGIMLIIMGLARLGSVIKFIPHPLITGFTSGIALIIFSSQIKDFLGLNMGDVPAEFIEKWVSFADHISSTDFIAVLIATLTVATVVLWSKVTHKVPGSLVAILLTTSLVHLFNLPIETIGSRFGNIPSNFPTPVVPDLDLDTIRSLIHPAFTIALLGGIESLLSAVVADGMIGGNHRSNTELIGQGSANILSALFGGIPATGAIARTATNVKNGGRTPIAGIMHAVTLLLIMLFVGKWAALIPMATLAGILVMIAYNMSEWKSFISVLRGPKSDRAVLLTTFLLTVLVDLTLAIEIGMVLAAFLFMRKMILFTEVNKVDIKNKSLSKMQEADSEAFFGNIAREFSDQPTDDSGEIAMGLFDIPDSVQVFEITGPLFFGAAYKFKDAMKLIESPPKFLIIRMRKVPIIDATGIKTIEEIFRDARRNGTKLLLSEVHSDQVRRELRDTRLLFKIGKANVTGSFPAALKRCRDLMA